MTSRTLSLTPLYITLLLIAGVLLGIGGLLGYQEYMNEDTNTPLYICPKTAWVDCMPGPDIGKKLECSSEFLTWAQANCPDFEGAAL